MYSIFVLGGNYYLLKILKKVYLKDQFLVSSYSKFVVSVYFSLLKNKRWKHMQKFLNFK